MESNAGKSNSTNRKSQMDSIIVHQVRDQIRNQVYTKVRDQIRTKMYKRFYYEIIDDVSHELRIQNVNRQVCRQLIVK
jgi:hypothetical protein